MASTNLIPPNLSADLHAQGLLSEGEALWVFNKDGVPSPNRKVLFDEQGNPNF